MQKGSCFQLQLTRNLSMAPCLRCCVETTEVTHKIRATPAQRSSHELTVISPHTALKAHFWCHGVILGLAKRKFPRRCKEPEAAPPSIQTKPSLSVDLDKAGGIWGLTTDVLWVYPMLLTAEKASDTCSNPIPWGWEPSLPSVALPI